jgi:hypothetical protein
LILWNPQKRSSASPHEPLPLIASTEFYQIVIESLSNRYNFFAVGAYICLQQTKLVVAILKKISKTINLKQMEGLT